VAEIAGRDYYHGTRIRYDVGMCEPAFEIDILLFGPAAMTAGCSSVRVACGVGSTCDLVREALCVQHGEIASIVKAGRLAVNGGYVEGGTVISAGDEVALVSLVSGG